MEATPENLDTESIISEIMSIRYVTGIHDMHVWQLTQGKPAMTAHIKIEKKSRLENVLMKATIVCRKHGIYHTSIQCETESNNDLLSNKYINCDQNLH